MAGIVAGQGGPAGLHGVAPRGHAVADPGPGAAARRSHGHDRDAARRTRPRPRSERRRQPVRPRERDSGPGGRAVRGLRASAETVASENVEKLGAVLVAAAGNDGPTGARFGTIASPAASPGWLAVGATDGRAKLPRANLTLRADGSENTLNDVPLVSALKPDDGVALALVLPSGPTESDIARAPADIATGASEGDFRAPDSTSLVRGKAVLLPRDGAPIAQRAAAAMAAGASALVLYGDGGAPAGSLGLDDDVALPITVISGEEGAAAAATLITGGGVTMRFTGRPPTTTRRSARSRRSRPRASRSTTPSSPTSSPRASPSRRPVPAAATSPRAARPSRRRRSPARPRSCCRRIPPGRRGVVRGALVGTASSARGRRRRRPAPVEAQGGGAVDPGRGHGGHGGRRAVVAHVRPGARRAVKVEARAHARQHEQGDDPRLALARPRRRGGRRRRGHARRRAVRRWRSPRGRPCPCRSRCGPTGCPRRRP